jgi:hypothetical protein
MLRLKHTLLLCGRPRRVSQLLPQRNSLSRSLFPLLQPKVKFPRRTSPHKTRWHVYIGAILATSGVGVIAFGNYRPFRHTVLSIVRCSRVAQAAVLSVIDYKRTFAKNYLSKEDEVEATSQCHTRSARRVLKALLANGGERERFISS